MAPTDRQIAKIRNPMGSNLWRTFRAPCLHQLTVKRLCLMFPSDFATSFFAPRHTQLFHWSLSERA